MVKIVQATCSNGELVVTEKLGEELEGKRVQIMIFEPSGKSEIDFQTSKSEQFLERVKNYSFKVPPDYKFNREEIYDR